MGGGRWGRDVQDWSGDGTSERSEVGEIEGGKGGALMEELVVRLTTGLMGTEGHRV